MYTQTENSHQGRDTWTDSKKKHYKELSNAEETEQLLC